MPYMGDLVGVTGSAAPGRSDAPNARSSQTRSATGGARAPWASWSSSPATSPAGPRRPSSSSSCWAGTSTSTTSVGDRGGTADIRDAGRAELAETAFDTYAHTADVRHIDTGRGRHNIPNVGLFLWRLQAYPFDRSTPFRSRRAIYVRSLGRDVPLFNRPAADGRLSIWRRNGTWRARCAGGHSTMSRLVVCRPRSRRTTAPIATSTRAIRYSRFGWATASCAPTSSRSATWEIRADEPSPPPWRPWIRFGAALRCEPAKPGGQRSRGLRASRGDLGGRNSYDRRASVRGALTAAQEAMGDAPWWQRGVVRDAVGPELLGDLASAVAAFAAGPAKPLALISVMDNRTYTDPIDVVVPGGSRLVIAAGDWQARPDPLGGPPRAASRGYRRQPHPPDHRCGHHDPGHALARPVRRQPWSSSTDFSSTVR